MPTNDLRNATFESGDIERPRHPHGDALVVKQRSAGRSSFAKPKLLLRHSQRDMLRLLLAVQEVIWLDDNRTPNLRNRSPWAMRSSPASLSLSATSAG